MSTFIRSGHFRVSPSGYVHWVREHQVTRETWDREFGQWSYWIRPEDERAYPTSCPQCHQPVFFVRHNGGSVWLDELGQPWPKHACFDQPGEHPASDLVRMDRDGVCLVVGRIVAAARTPRIGIMAEIECGDDRTLQGLIKGWDGSVDDLAEREVVLTIGTAERDAFVPFRFVTGPSDDSDVYALVVRRRMPTSVSASRPDSLDPDEYPPTVEDKLAEFGILGRKKRRTRRSH